MTVHNLRQYRAAVIILLCLIILGQTERLRLGVLTDIGGFTSAWRAYDYASRLLKEHGGPNTPYVIFLDRSEPNTSLSDAFCSLLERNVSAVILNTRWLDGRDSKEDVDKLVAMALRLFIPLVTTDGEFHYSLPMQLPFRDTFVRLLPTRYDEMGSLAYLSAELFTEIYDPNDRLLTIFAKQNRDHDRLTALTQELYFWWSSAVFRYHNDDQYGKQPEEALFRMYDANRWMATTHKPGIIYGAEGMYRHQEQITRLTQLMEGENETRWSFVHYELFLHTEWLEISREKNNTDHHATSPLVWVLLEQNYTRQMLTLIEESGFFRDQHIFKKNWLIQAPPLVPLTPIYSHPGVLIVQPELTRSDNWRKFKEFWLNNGGSENDVLSGALYAEAILTMSLAFNLSDSVSPTMTEVYHTCAAVNASNNILLVERRRRLQLFVNWIKSKSMKDKLKYLSNTYGVLGTLPSGTFALWRAGVYRDGQRYNIWNCLKNGSFEKVAWFQMYPGSASVQRPTVHYLKPKRLWYLLSPRRPKSPPPQTPTDDIDNSTVTTLDSNEQSTNTTNEFMVINDTSEDADRKESVLMGPNHKLLPSAPPLNSSSAYTMVLWWPSQCATEPPLTVKVAPSPTRLGLLLKWLFDMTHSESESEQMDAI